MLRYARRTLAIIACLSLPALNPSYVNAQLPPGALTPPSPETSCQLQRSFGSLRADVDLLVLPPTFTRRSPPGAPEEFAIQTRIINYSSTDFIAGTAIYITREQGISGSGKPSGEPDTIKFVELPSLRSCRLSPPVSYMIAISACARPPMATPPVYNRCLRNFFNAFFTPTSILLSSGFRDSNNTNNSFVITGNDLANRFGIP